MHVLTATSLRGRCRIAALVASAAVVAIVVSACGSTPTPPPTPAPTPAPTIRPLSSIVPVPDQRLDAPTEIGANAKSAAALQATLSGIVSGGVPGAQAAVVYPDGSTWAGTAGVAVKSTGQAMTADTLLSVASITKTFTGAVAMRLVESGKISLDDPLSKYMPDYPNAANITLLELMNHTSGISDIFEPHAYYYVQARKSIRWTAEQMLTQIGQPYFAPGTGYHYSSTNYVILGMVIEMVTGQQLAALIRSEFLEPLGLDHTFLQSEETPVGPLAHGYLGTAKSPKDVSVGQSLIPYVSAATATGAAGAVASTATDVAKWANALYSGQVFGQGTLAAILDITDTEVYKPYFPYGLGTEKFVLSGHLAYGHRGHVDGFWSMVAYVPDLGVTISLLTNADWVNPVTQMTKLLGAATVAG